MDKSLKLVTSKLSPYGHRVETLLIEKEIPYQKEEILLANKPEWFASDSRHISNVPVLYVNEKPIFESIAICEFLEDFYPKHRFHPEDLEERAVHRSWMEVTNSLCSNLFEMVFAQDETSFESKKKDLMIKCSYLNKNCKASPYFFNDQYSILDICLTSAIKPLSFFDERFSLGILDSNRNLLLYSYGALVRTSFNKILPEGYESILMALLERKKSYLLTIK